MTCACCRNEDRLTAQVRGVELCDECATFHLAAVDQGVWRTTVGDVEIVRTWQARAEAAEQQLQALQQENAELLAVIASWHRKWDEAQASLTQPGAAGQE